MPILHLLQINQGDSPAVEDCLASVTPGDTVVVISDAPAAVFDAVFASLQEKNTVCSFLPIDPENRTASSRSVQIHYADLIELTHTHPRIVSWF